MSLTRIVQRRNIIPSNVAPARAWTDGEIATQTVEIVAGDKRLLLLVYHAETNDIPAVVSSATISGVPGTIYAQSGVDTGFAAAVTYIYWTETQLQTIGLGTFTPVITASGTVAIADDERIASQVYTGVDQSNPFTAFVTGALGGDGGFTYPDIVRNEGSYLIASNSSGNAGGVATPPANFTTVVTSPGTSSDVQVHESFEQSQYNESATFTATGNNRIAFLMAALNRSEAA